MENPRRAMQCGPYVPPLGLNSGGLAERLKGLPWQRYCERSEDDEKSVARVGASIGLHDKHAPEGPYVA
jgi:hypothetical protein